ncbi:MAG: lysoplasmalogenase, partial [Armatimonadetes bacterium]|nr:lysoplasmalogenase [Armatimonadota bacterium]
LADLALPVAVYVVVICAMMWRACAAALDASPTARSAAAVGAIGAVAFGLSDTLIAFGRWGGPVTAGPLAVMGLYWAGQLGIAASAVAFAGAEPPR